MGNVFDLSEEKFLRAVNGAMNLFVVEYSVEGDTSSIRTLERVLRDNHKKICNGIPKDYLPVGLFKSHEDALRFSLHFQTVIAPQAQLESRSRRWQQVSDCFATELEALLKRSEFHEDKSEVHEK